MKLQFCPYILKFKEPAGTSRGVMTEKLTAFLRIFDESKPEIYGIGEAAIFPGLSPEADDRFFYKVVELVTNVRLGLPTDLSRFPSLQFGLEQALMDFSSGGKGIYFDSPFVRGNSDIVINGLIWMGNYDEMLHRVESKLQQGFRCIKFKIGAISWEDELKLIRDLRSEYSSDEVEIRVDANGAFSPDKVMNYLDQLAQFDIHSIEQPIKAGQVEEMARLCEISPVPIALDEELIGHFYEADKRCLLHRIKPQYIVIKPSLTGGFSGASEWIRLASENECGWWITSSLESNVGLNALSQWVATLDVSMPQGLGTGALFTNNLPSPLILDGEFLRYDPTCVIDRGVYDILDWRD